MDQSEIMAATIRLHALISNCDVIKQNESEVGQIQFWFFWLIVYIICKATFYNQPIEI